MMVLVLMDASLDEVCQGTRRPKGPTEAAQGISQSWKRQGEACQGGWHTLGLEELEE